MNDGRDAGKCGTGNSHTDAESCADRRGCPTKSSLS
jgi:hypothetical protein